MERDGRAVYRGVASRKEHHVDLSVAVDDVAVVLYGLDQMRYGAGLAVRNHRTRQGAAVTCDELLA